MDIPNLSTIETPVSSKNNKNIITIMVIIIVFGITAGFWVSRFWPTKTSISSSNTNSNIKNVATDLESLQINVVYGDTGDTFNDSATGTLEEGGVNGEGTHNLQREGGDSQTVALTSSTVDLELFVGKKVEVNGETNTSNKAAWFLDVGNIKIIE